MTAKEMRNYKMQTVKMCIQTFFNMNGVMPGIQDMIDWLGETFANVIPLCLTDPTAA